MTKKWTAWVGIVVILGCEFLIRDAFLPTQANEIHIRNSIIAEWAILLLFLLLWIPRVEKQSFESIGFGKFKRRYVWIGIFVFILTTVVLAFNGIVLEALGLEPIRSLQPILKTYSFFTLFGLFLTGTFLEEVFYRGYIIERLAALTGRRWLAGLVSWAAFTLVHLRFFGLGPTLDVSILSAALVILYLKEESIWPCIVTHGINNALSYLVFPSLIG
jgi:membrane protease YdiL (CAAX protease family)